MAAYRMKQMAGRRITYPNLLKIGLAVGFFNLFAIAIRSQIFGEASANWYAFCLIAAIPAAILCAWLTSKAQRNWS